jgi:hypothetical protein
MTHNATKWRPIQIRRNDAPISHNLTLVDERLVVAILTFSHVCWVIVTDTFGLSQNCVDRRYAHHAFVHNRKTNVSENVMIGFDFFSMPGQPSGSFTVFERLLCGVVFNFGMDGSA